MADWRGAPKRGSQVKPAYLIEHLSRLAQTGEALLEQGYLLVRG